MPVLRFFSPHPSPWGGGGQRAAAAQKSRPLALRPAPQRQGHRAAGAWLGLLFEPGSAALLRRRGWAFLLLWLAACQPAVIVPAASNQAQPYVWVSPPAKASPSPFLAPAFTPSLFPSLTPRPFTATPTFTPPPPTATPSPAPSAPPLAERPFYNLNALWDYAAHSLTVAEEITYPNHTGQTLTELPLLVNPNLWNGVFRLDSLSVNGSAASGYSLNGQALMLTLNPPLGAEQSVRVQLVFGLNLPYSAGKFENFGWTGRQSNLVDWFPFVPPYLPESGWLMRESWAYGENLAYPLADFAVQVAFVDVTPIVAASTLPLESAPALRYSLPEARTFTLSASPDFVVTSSSADGVTFLSYTFPENAAAGQATLAYTQSAAQTYARFYGPYPHASLSVVETLLNDGLESDGLFFLAQGFYEAYDGSAANNLALIGVHETAHQWFFGLISNDQALEPWLDEALATYSEHLFYETNLPGLLNWWYNSRIYAYAPGGFVDTRLYNTTSFRSYVDAVYLRGALFLDALRQRMGDEAFLAFLRDYVDRHRGHLATADTFFAVLAEHTSAADDLIAAFFRYR